MEAAFAWLGDIWNWLWQFVPKRQIVKTTHGAIKWRWGADVHVLGPGAYWYWPYSTEWEEYPTARQASDLPTQTMESTDGVTFVVGAMIVYEIQALEKLLAYTFDPEETIKDISQGAVHDVCSRKTWAELKEPSLDLALRREVRRRLTPYGVRTRRVTLTSLARCRVLKLMQSSSQEGT